MNKKYLKAVADEAKRFTTLYKNDKERGFGLSYSEWLKHTEISTRNKTIYAKTEATLGIYEAEDGEKAIDTSPDIAVMGTEEFPDVFPKMGQIYALRDEEAALIKEFEEIQKKKDQKEKAEKAKQKKKSKLDTIPEENENEEIDTTEKKVEKKELSPEDKRIGEINKRLKEIAKENVPLNKELDEFKKKRDEFDNKMIERNRKKATEKKKEHIEDLKNAEKNGLLSRLGLLCAAKDRLNNRTWKDYLFHPFRSIGENMRYSEMRENFLDEYGMNEKQLDAIVSNIGNGEKDLDSLKSIEKDGTVVNQEKGAPVREEKDLSVKVEEKEDLKIKLDNEFSSEISQLSEKKEPAVEEPKLEGPELNK